MLYFLALYHWTKTFHHRIEMDSTKYEFILLKQQMIHCHASFQFCISANIRRGCCKVRYSVYLAYFSACFLFRKPFCRIPTTPAHFFLKISSLKKIQWQACRTCKPTNKKKSKKQALDPKTYGKMTVLNPQYIGEITPKHEGTVGFHGINTVWNKIIQSSLQIIPKTGPGRNSALENSRLAELQEAWLILCSFGEINFSLQNHLEMMHASSTPFFLQKGAINFETHPMALCNSTASQFSATSSRVPIAKHFSESIGKGARIYSNMLQQGSFKHHQMGGWRWFFQFQWCLSKDCEHISIEQL